jgi:predicted transcriptional regulator
MPVPPNRRRKVLKKLKSEIELLGRHLEVLRVVAANQPIGIMKLAEVLGLPYHRVRYSLRVLEGMGYIRASPAGATVTERAREDLAGLDGEIDGMITLLEGMRKDPSSKV